VKSALSIVPLLVLLPLFTLLASGCASTRPPYLSAYGRALWDFERQTRGRYGNSVCFSDKSPTHLASGPQDCMPLSQHPPYFFLFRKDGLTLWGRFRWDLEALIKDVFGGRSVCWKLDKYPESLGIDVCPDRRERGLFRHLFVGARHSTLRLITSRPQERFGNYPLLVTVRNRFVACDTAHLTYLVVHPNAAFPTVNCVEPL
jgi:hypothetical protein